MYVSVSSPWFFVAISWVCPLESHGGNGIYDSKIRSPLPFEGTWLVQRKLIRTALKVIAKVSRNSLALLDILSNPSPWQFYLPDSEEGRSWKQDRQSFSPA